MKKFKPNFRPSILNLRSYKTYRELKKDLRGAIEMSRDNEVTVSRSRRGEWGEWFERWSIIQGKPKITKQGWL